MKVHCQNMEHYYGRFSEIYNEGVRTWVPLTVDRERALEKRDMEHGIMY